MNLHVKYPNFEMWAMNWKYFKLWRSMYYGPDKTYPWQPGQGGQHMSCQFVTWTILEACLPTIVTSRSQRVKSQQWFHPSADGCLSLWTVKMDPAQTTFLLSPVCFPLLWRRDGTPIWELQCFLNPSPVKRHLLIVLNRGRNLTVKNATRAA